MDRGLLGELRIFFCVVDLGSLSAAAAKLGVPLPSVSRRIRDLEERVGVQLLHRTTRQLTVTEAGRGLYEHAIDAVEEIETSLDAIRQRSGKVEGELRVLAPYGLGQIVIGPLIPGFRARYPEVNLCLQLDNKALDLVQFRFDIAIRKGPVPDSTYSVRPWRRMRTRLVASPSYLTEAPPIRRLEDLERHALLSVADDFAPVSWALTGPEGPATVRAFSVFAANEPTVVLSHAIAGQGVALLSYALTRRALDEGLLFPVLPGYHGLKDTEYVMLFPTRATSDLKVRAFIDHLMEHAADPEQSTF